MMNMYFCLASVLVLASYAENPEQTIVDNASPQEPEVASLANQSSPAEYFAKAVAERDNIPKLAPDVVVEVYYIEHVLASWVLQAAPWNAYHSGIGFKVYDMPSRTPIGQYTIDFSPRLTEQVKYQLHPVITPVYPAELPPFLGRIYAWITASYDITWENEGSVRYSAFWSKKYENSTFIGEITGAMFNEYLEWVYQYDDSHKAFEPVEIIVNHSLNIDERVRGSSMCHDLFYYSLDKLIELGFDPDPEEFIFRDHIMVFASSYVEVDISDWSTRRKVVRYFQLFENFMVHINKEFTHIRNLLVGADILSVVPYLYKNGKYYQVSMVPPYVNYCYLPVFMPPRRASVWSEEKFCALEMHLSSNRTVANSLISGAQLLYLADSAADEPLFWIISVALVSLLFIRMTVVLARGTSEKEKIS